MENNMTPGLIGVGVLVAAALSALAVYRWRQENRVSRINGWVTKYLLVRYRELPAKLRINCSHDASWPVLVDFDTPGTGIRHSVQFSCSGLPPTWFLLSEKDDERMPAFLPSSCLGPAGPPNVPVSHASRI